MSGPERVVTEPDMDPRDHAIQHQRPHDPADLLADIDLRMRLGRFALLVDQDHLKHRPGQQPAKQDDPRQGRIDQQVGQRPGLHPRQLRMADLAAQPQLHARNREQIDREDHQQVVDAFKHRIRRPEIKHRIAAAPANEHQHEAEQHKRCHHRPLGPFHGAPEPRKQSFCEMCKRPHEDAENQ